MKTELGKARNFFSTLLSNGFSGDITVRSIVLSNVSTQSVSIEARFARQGQTFAVLSSSVIPVGNSLVLDPIKDEFLYLQPGDSIELKCNLDMGVDFAASYDLGSQSAVAESSSSSSSASPLITFALLRRTEQSLGWTGGVGAASVSSGVVADQAQNNPMPDDLRFEIKNEKFGGVDAYGLVNSVVWSDPDQAFVISIDPSYEVDGSTEFSLQFDVNDPRFSTIRKKFIFKGADNYRHETLVAERVSGSYVPFLSESSIDFLLGFLSDLWSWYDSQGSSSSSVGSRPLFPSPDEVPGDFGTWFDPLAHAKYKILEEVPFDGYSSIEEYSNDNIEAIRAHSLDRNLIDLFYNQGVADTEDLDNPSGLAALAAPRPAQMASAIQGLNFLGVSQSVFDCILKAPLYLGRPFASSWPIFVGGNGDDNAFDCRSFSESAAIMFRSSLKTVCPNAMVWVAEVCSHDHAINYIDLGGLCPDGNPCECCTGSFFYEPQNGQVFESELEFSRKTDIKPCNPTGVELRDPSVEKPGERTGWEDSPEQVRRIANLICACMPLSPAEGTSENTIKQQCDSGNMQQWFVENFAYNNSSKNGVGKTPSLPLPNIISCQLYKCDPILGCVQREDGDLTEYECARCVERWECGSDCACGSVGKSIDEKKKTSLVDCQSDCTACDCWVCGSDGPQNVGPKTAAECSQLAGFRKQSDLPCCQNQGAGQWSTNCEKKCLYEWNAEYDCANNSWFFLRNGKPKSSCVSTTVEEGVWRLGESYFSYKVSGGECSVLGDCVNPPPKPSDPGTEYDPDCNYCITHWQAEYNCSLKSWSMKTLGENSKFCGNPEVTNVWESVFYDSCLMDYRQKTGLRCANFGRDEWDNQTCLNQNAEPPGLPSNTPADCCTYCLCGPNKTEANKDVPGAVSCSDCKEVWECGQNGPVASQNPDGSQKWSTTGPFQEEIISACKQIWECDTATGPKKSLNPDGSDKWSTEGQSQAEVIDTCKEMAFCDATAPDSTSRCQILGWGPDGVPNGWVGRVHEGMVDCYKECSHRWECKAIEGCVQDSSVWSDDEQKLKKCDVSICFPKSYNCLQGQGCSPVYDTSGEFVGSSPFPVVAAEEALDSCLQNCAYNTNKCIYEWAALYDCDSSSWKVVETPIKTCSDLSYDSDSWVMVEQWNECRLSYFKVGDSCAEEQGCSSPPSAPAAPTASEPTGCCEDCLQCKTGKEADGAGLINLGSLDVYACALAGGEFRSKFNNGYALCCFDESTQEWKTDCERKWILTYKARYNCGQGAWEFVGPSPAWRCGYLPLKPQTWVDTTTDYFYEAVYNIAGEECTEPEPAAPNQVDAPQLPQTDPTCYCTCNMSSGPTAPGPIRDGAVPCSDCQSRYICNQQDGCVQKWSSDEAWLADPEMFETYDDCRYHCEYDTTKYKNCWQCFELAEPFGGPHNVRILNEETCSGSEIKEDLACCYDETTENWKTEGCEKTCLYDKIVRYDCGSHSWVSAYESGRPAPLDPETRVRCGYSGPIGKWIQPDGMGPEYRMWTSLLNNTTKSCGSSVYNDCVDPFVLSNPTRLNSSFWPTDPGFPSEELPCSGSSSSTSGDSSSGSLGSSSSVGGCYCDPFMGPRPVYDPGTETAVDCSLCKETWRCDTAQGAVKDTNWDGSFKWSVEGPFEEEVKLACTPMYQCNSGTGCQVYGYGPEASNSASGYNIKVYETVEGCESACVRHFYCSTEGCAQLGYFSDEESPTNYKKIEDCQTHCAQFWRCDGQYGCLSSYYQNDTSLTEANGYYSSKINCDSNCLLRYDCDLLVGCKSGYYAAFEAYGKMETCDESNCKEAWYCSPPNPSGGSNLDGCQGFYNYAEFAPFSTLAEYATSAACKEQCVRRYTCDSSVGCKQDDNKSDDQAKYITCDENVCGPMSWNCTSAVCEPRYDTSGKYSTLALCADSCIEGGGACCVGGSCSISTEVGCQSLGGIWQGLGVTCDMGSCESTCCVDSTNDNGCAISICQAGHFTCLQNCYSQASVDTPMSGHPFCQVGTILPNTVTVSGVVFDTGDTDLDAFLYEAFNRSYTTTRDPCTGAATTGNFQLGTYENDSYSAVVGFPTVQIQPGSLATTFVNTAAVGLVTGGATVSRGERSLDQESMVVVSTKCGYPLYDCGSLVGGPPTDSGGIVGWVDWSGATITVS